MPKQRTKPPSGPVNITTGTTTRHMIVADWGNGLLFDPFNPAYLYFWDEASQSFKMESGNCEGEMVFFDDGTWEQTLLISWENPPGVQNSHETINTGTWETTA